MVYGSGNDKKILTFEIPKKIAEQMTINGDPFEMSRFDLEFYEANSNNKIPFKNIKKLTLINNKLSS